MTVNYYHYNSLCINVLFPDAEAGEDGVEDFLGGDGACYCGEVVFGFAQVVGQEVGGEG